MNEIAETCSLCNKPNDQMLMLSCIHDPCINCAASAYAEQIYIKAQNKEVYVCEICGEETLLDNTTIRELSALASSVIKLPSKTTPNKPMTYQAGTSAKRKETQVTPTPTVPAKKITYYCKDHSQQEISYYCFSCWTNICPECAIHGGHKDHNVKLIKKAISQVKGQYVELIAKTNDYQGGMGKMKENYLRLIKETNDRHTREKNTITREFDIIRSNLATKQKEMMKELQELNKHNLAALTNFLETINSNYEDANKLKRTIEVINKKDDVLILEQYRKINELKENLQEIEKNVEGISGQSSHLNIEFLQQECKETVEIIGKLKVNLKKEDIGGKTDKPRRTDGLSPK